jgi:opacity protein-like surface antigen
MRSILNGLVLAAAAAVSANSADAQDVPETIKAPGETAVLKVYAEGAQVYECKADQAGKLAWTFREPVATLIQDGKTIGRHYAGPHWELVDGSIIQGKVSGRAPGASAEDIPWLKLEVSQRKGQGQLADVTTIQRINTKGGALEGACEKAGSFKSMAYATDYVFLKK